MASIEAPSGPEQEQVRNLDDIVEDVRSKSTQDAEKDAEKDTAEVRPTLAPSRSQTDLGSSQRRSTSNISDLGRPTTGTKRLSYVPAIPSPLNPTRSNSIHSNGGERAGAEGEVSPSTSTEGSSDISRSQSSENIPGRGRRSVQVGRTATPVQQGMGQLSALTPPSRSHTRPSTPKRLKDLGRDYSRYPPSRDVSPGTPQKAAAAEVSLLRTTTVNPFNDSQADLERWGYPDDRIGIFDPYHGGEKGFILYKDEVEADDKFHTPADDDDAVYKPKLKEYFGDRRSIVSAIGGTILILGLICIFIILPILTFATNKLVPKPAPGTIVSKYGPAWAHVNNETYPLLKNVRTGLIDPDTPASAKTRKSTFDGSNLKLVFSDEFNTDNRSFYQGDDPFWTAPNIWYGATQDMEWYDPDAVTTGNGTLQLKMDSFPNHGLQFRSGMLNSWNQLCFKGGVFEVSVSLAGPAGIPGLWPGAWTMGNLGRPGHLATTDGVWPYTYDSCDAGITPNQSSIDGLSFLPGQRLNTCTCKGEDHPSPGLGRGAPEIDILEGSVDPNNRIGVVTQSYQVAPFDVWYRPNADFMALPNYNTSQMNAYCGGPYQQAVSATTLLNNEWYDGNQYQKYAFEYIPGTSQGKIAWFVGEDPTFIMDGRAIGPNGNVAARQVSEEPMSMILNLGMSGSWSQILMGDLKFPTTMHIDYVRLYQKPGSDSSVTCDPVGYPTTEYIKNHPKAYQNPNVTHWDQTGYGWPKNKLAGC